MDMIEKVYKAIISLKNEPTDERVRAVLAVIFSVEDNSDCKQCSGFGQFVMQAGDGNTTREACKKCAGTGRRGVY